MGVSIPAPDCACGTVQSRWHMVIFRYYIRVAMSFGDVACLYGDVMSVAQFGLQYLYSSFDID